MDISDAAKDAAKKIGGKIVEEAGNRIATGVGDKISGAFAAKSEEAETEIESPNKDSFSAPDSQSELVSTIEKISTIPELSDYLTELQSKQDSESALAYAIKAQLQVITVVTHPNLSSSPFDLMLESLKVAVQKSRNEFEKTEFQRKAAVMVNSMVFFMEAKFYYDGDKWKKEGQDLLKEACGMLADSACSIAGMAMTGGVTAPLVAKKLGASLFDSIISNRGGFITRVIDFFSKAGRLAKYQAEFYSFLESTFEKLLRYQKLFGSSSILRNLVLKHKDALNGRVNDKSRELQKLDPENPVLKLKDITGGIRFFYCSVGIFFILLAVVFGGSYLFYLFNLWGGDKWVESLANSSVFDMVFSIHFGILEHPLFLKIIIVALGYLPTIFSARAVPSLGFDNIKIVENRRREKRITQAVDEYYTLLADKLDEYQEV